MKSAAKAVNNAFITEKVGYRGDTQHTHTLTHTKLHTLTHATPHSQVNQAIAKVAEVHNPATSLSKQEFADDLALTGMAR